MNETSDQANRPQRSALFVPGDKPRAIEKAGGLGADALILDLEDAVAPEMKAEARNAASEAFARWAAEAPSAERVLRVNATSTGEFEADAALAAGAEVEAVLLPKADGPDIVRAARRTLDEAGYHGPLWLMIESPAAVLNLRLITELTAPARLFCLVAGTNDLCAGLRCHISGEKRDTALPYLSQILLAARAHGLAALDGVYNEFSDVSGFTFQAREARAIGFDGKTLIHPKQVDPANRAFSPSAEEVDWARTVANEFAKPENAGRGAIAIGGRMVERMHLDAAKAVLAAARADGET